MERKYSITLFVLVIAGLTISFIHSRQTSSSGYYVLDPVKFVYSASGAPGMAGVISGKEISENELLERSPVLFDLALQECKMLGEAALKIGHSKKVKPAVTVFMSEPGEKFKSALEKLKLPVRFKFSPEKPGKAVAQMDGKPMTRDELALNQVHYSELKSAQFKEKLTVLKDLLVRQILFKAAQAEKTTIEDYTDKEILKGGVQVSDQDINNFMSEKGITFGKKAQSERERLRLILLEQKRNVAINAYVRKNFSEKGMIFFLPPLYAFPVNDDKMIVAKGNQKALPVLVFSNLQCTTCLPLAKELMSLRNKYSRGIRVGFVNLFSPEDWHSELAAEAAFCLNDQDNKYFWKFYDSLASNKEPATEEDIDNAVKKVGAKYEPFRDCLLKQKYKKAVSDQVKYAHDFGVVTLPTVIIGSNVLTGPIKLEDMDQILASRVPAAGWFTWLTRF